MRQTWERSEPVIEVANSNLTEWVGRHFPGAEVTGVELLSGGLSNTNYLVTLRGGPSPLRLRVYNRGARTAALELAVGRLVPGWFHTGAYLEKEKLELGLQKEYFRGGPPELLLPDTILPKGLCYEDARQATRALRGSLLRSEVYADDGTDKAGLPYIVTEQSVEVRMLQSSELAPRRLSRLHYGVFFVHSREAVTVHSERNPDDPRVVHEFTLDVDDFGNVTRQASIAYARRNAPHAEQAKAWATLNETDFINKPNEEDWYRIGVRFQARNFELTGLTLPESGQGLLSISALRAALDSLDPLEDLPFEGKAGGTQLERRFLTHQQQLFYRNDLSGPLLLGELESLALPFESYQLALTSGQVTQLVADSKALAGTAFEPSLLLSEGRYVQRNSVDYWTASGRAIFDPGRFYLPIEAIDPFGEHFFLSYDEHALLVTETRDPLGNLVRADNDYRILAPRLMTDPNLNRTAVRFDALGMVVATAVMGKEGAGEGDTLDDPTTRLEYDLFAFQERGEPAFVHTFAREQHFSVNPASRIQESFTYSDGFGRVVMEKVQAEPGEAPLRDENGVLQRHEDGALVLGPVSERWVGTGRTVFNNKGNPVKQYEPFFSATSDFEDEASIVETGVTPLIHYDPLDRVIRTELPNGTESWVEFDAWQQTDFDPNDAIEGTRWLSERLALPAGNPERRAAELTLRDANTPAVTHLDALGRTFLAIAHNRADGRDEFFETRSELDVQGNVLSITDARGVVTIRQRYDVLAQRLRVDSPDAGARLMVADVAGKPLRAWDSRHQTLRSKYDALQRPTHFFVEHDGTERLLLRTVYGESLDPSGSSSDLTSPSPAQQRNLRGQVVQLYDCAGLVESERFDFKANLLEASRRLAKDYKTEPDWIATDALTDPTAIEAAAAPLLDDERFEQRMTYDALNRVTSSTMPDGSVTRPTYNEANLLEQLHVRLRGNAEQRVIENLDYNARGQRILGEYTDPTTGEVSYRTEYTYDTETFRLTRLFTRRASDSIVLQDLRYTYDSVGNIVELRDHADTKPIFSGTKPVSGDGKYEYDALYRLIKAEGREHPGQQPTEADPPLGSVPHANDLQALTRYVERYTYDSVGNIERIQHRPERRSATSGWTRRYQYAHDSNRLLATSLPGDDERALSAKYTYDAHGSMTSMPHLAVIDWDYAARMKHVDKGGGGHVFFTYDASGQRVRKVWDHSGLVEERFYFGGCEIYRRRRGDALELERETLHVMDDQRRVAMVETKTVDPTDPALLGAARWRFQLDNLLGSAVLELDKAGNVISYEEYHPYGSTAFHSARAGAEVSAKRYRYTGKERDEETGLYYHGARYYAAWLGRWTAADPMGLIDGLNLYRYSRNNPVLFSDPTGTLGTTQREEELGMSLPEEHPLAPIDSNEPTEQEHQAQQSLPEEERYLSSYPTTAESTTLVGTTIRTGLAAIRETYTPVSPAGQPLTGPLNLYTGEAARARAAAAPGHIIPQTVYYGPANELEQQLRLQLGIPEPGRLPPELYNPIWERASRNAVIDATLSGQGVTSHNELRTLDPSSIQARVELPYTRILGSAAGGLTVASGALSIVAMTDPELPPALIPTTAIGGAMEITGGTAMIIGSLGAEGSMVAAGAAVAETGGLFAIPLLMWTNIKMSVENQRALQPTIERLHEEGNYIGAALLSMPITAGGIGY